MAVMHVPYGEVDIQPAGAHDGVVRVRCGENVVVLIMHDDLIRQLATKANAHLDRRAAQKILAMMAAERERRRRGERPDTLAVMAEVRVKE